MSTLPGMPSQERDAFDDFMDTIGAKWFNAKVAGITFPNADGTDRQAIAKTLAERDQVYVQPEPENAYDKKAIALMTSEGKQLGYLEARVAAEVTRRFEKGHSAPLCYVRAVRDGSTTCGVSIAIAYL